MFLSATKFGILIYSYATILHRKHLLENKAIAQDYPWVAQEMTHNLLVPSVYIPNKNRESEHLHIFLSTLEEKLVWQQMSPVRKNMCISYIFKFLWLFFILNNFLFKYDSISCSPECWQDWDQKYWRYLHFKCHFRANNRCDKNVAWIESNRLIQGLHCSCLTPPVMVQIACRSNMTSPSIQQMLQLGCIIFIFTNWLTLHHIKVHNFFKKRNILKEK